MKETIACFKASSEYNVEIIGLDMNEMRYNINEIDVFYQVPASDAPEYFDVVMEIALKEQVDVVMPLHSKELIPFAQRRELFEKAGMVLAVPPLAGLQIANDKIRSYTYMKENGFPVPETLVTKSKEEAKCFLEAHPDMLFVTKLPDGCGARGFYVISQTAVEGVEDKVVLKPSELYRVFDGATEVLLQTYLPGKEYTTDMVLVDGKCVAYYTKECMSMERGVIRQAVIVDAPEVSKLCINFAESLGLSGNVGFDIKCDAQGRPMIIDVNPRITATIGLGRYGGLNLPLLGLLWVKGELRPTIVQTAKPGARIVRQIADYYFNESGALLEQ